MYLPSRLLSMWASAQGDYVTRLQNSGCSVVIVVLSYADSIPDLLTLLAMISYIATPK